MQYQFTERFEYIKSIEFKNTIALHNVKKIDFFKEEDISGVFLSKQFRYSFDNTIWSNWIKLTQASLAAIQFRNNPNFYLEVKYERAGVMAGNILKWYLFYQGDPDTPPIPPVEASINADFLNGEPGSYYLNNENHYGPHTTINIQNLPDASAIGIYDDRYDSSLGTTFYFKPIKCVNGIKANEVGNSIELSLDASISNQIEYHNDTSVAVTVGGIIAGQSFFSDAKSFAETMEAMFYPTINPTLVAPYNTFSDDADDLNIIGTIININFSSTFNRGAINIGSTFQNYRSGNVIGYNFNDPSNNTLLHDVSTSALLNVQTVNNYKVIQGVQTFSSQVHFAQGPQPLDNKGNAYSTPLPAGWTNFRLTTIEGVYPLYATSILINALSQQGLQSMITGNNIQMNLVPESGGYRQSFEVPIIWLNSRPLLGIQTLNTMTMNWEYEGGTSSSSLSRWNTSSTSKNINGVIVNYRKYSYNSTERGAINIRLNF